MGRSPHARGDETQIPAAPVYPSNSNIFSWKHFAFQNHTACRAAQTPRPFRSVPAGRRCAVAPRSAIFQWQQRSSKAHARYGHALAQHGHAALRIIPGSRAFRHTKQPVAPQPAFAHTLPDSPGHPARLHDHVNSVGVVQQHQRQHRCPVLPETGMAVLSRHRPPQAPGQRLPAPVPRPAGPERISVPPREIRQSGFPASRAGTAFTCSSERSITPSLPRRDALTARPRPHHSAFSQPPSSPNAARPHGQHGAHPPPSWTDALACRHCTE